MTTENCVSGPKLVLKDLFEKSLLLGITAQLAFFLWNSNSSWHDFLVLSVAGVCPLSDSFRALSMHSGEISRKLEASRVSSEWLCSHSVSKEQDHLLSILNTIWKGQLLLWQMDSSVIISVVDLYLGFSCECCVGIYNNFATYSRLLVSSLSLTFLRCCLLLRIRRSRFLLLYLRSESTLLTFLHSPKLSWDNKMNHLVGKPEKSPL